MVGRDYRPTLASLLEEYSRTDRHDALVLYLASNSNLPGPRGNLELLEAFSGELRRFCQSEPARVWRLSLQLGSDPDEFVAMCGVRGVGQVGGTTRAYFARAVAKLRATASDSRWRVREAVAMSIQWLILDRPETVGNLEDWVSKGGWFEMRAVAAGVAEPRLVKNLKLAESSLALHRKILDKFISSKDRRSEGFKALRKCLAYSVSVVVAAVPREGFTYMTELANLADPDVRWVCSQNLKKNRLRSKFAREVAVLEKAIA